MDELANLISKRETAPIAHGLHVFRGYDPITRRNEYNALYFPDLTAYIRFGNLRPDKLLEMLEEDGCERAILFRNCVDSSTEDSFFVFTLGISKSDYHVILENAWEKRQAAMFEALNAMAEYREGIIPLPLRNEDSRT